MDNWFLVFNYFFHLSSKQVLSTYDHELKIVSLEQFKFSMSQIELWRRSERENEWLQRIISSDFQLIRNISIIFAVFMRIGNYFKFELNALVVSHMRYARAKVIIRMASISVGTVFAVMTPVEPTSNPMVGISLVSLLSCL